LQEEIATTGLLIAEQPPGIEPRARHFPYRNRIIAGLAQAVLVVEAAPKSGSLITARYAGEFGREVLAVPGSPLDPRAGVAEPVARYVPAPADAEAADRQAVADLLGPVPTPVDEIVRQSGRPAAVVQTVLLELELAGRLDRHAGGQVSLTL
jgi:DNA processing protein